MTARALRVLLAVLELHVRVRGMPFHVLTFVLMFALGLVSTYGTVRGWSWLTDCGPVPFKWWRLLTALVIAICWSHFVTWTPPSTKKGDGP